MATPASARECPICLDKFRNPVVTPCGHLVCDPCIKSYARRSSNPYEATCPTCRTPFPIVTPNMSIIPKKYHVFISLPLRRVFLGDADNSNYEATIEELNAENAALKARVRGLKRDKDLLMDRCEAAQSALARLTSDERAARLSRDEAREDARVAKLNFEKLRVEHEALVVKSRDEADEGSGFVTKAKRARWQAALNDLVRNSSNNSPEFSRTPTDSARPIRPMPKRPRLLPARAVSPERTVRQSYPNPMDPRILLSSESSSSPEPAPRTSAQSVRRSCDSGMRGNVRAARSVDSSSDDEADDHSEGSDMEDVPAAPSPVRIIQDAPLPSPVIPRNPRRSVRLQRLPMS